MHTKASCKQKHLHTLWREHRRSLTLHDVPFHCIGMKLQQGPVPGSQQGRGNEIRRAFFFFYRDFFFIFFFTMAISVIYHPNLYLIWTERNENKTRGGTSSRHTAPAQLWSHLSFSLFLLSLSTRLSSSIEDSKIQYQGDVYASMSSWKPVPGPMQRGSVAENVRYQSSRLLRPRVQQRRTASGFSHPYRVVRTYILLCVCMYVCMYGLWSPLPQSPLTIVVFVAVSNTMIAPVKES